MRCTRRSTGVLPDVRVAEGQVRFPPTFVGASSQLPLTLVNGAPVPATLVCDLAGLPEFDLLLSREWSCTSRACAGWHHYAVSCT